MPDRSHTTTRRSTPSAAPTTYDHRGSGVHTDPDDEPTAFDLAPVTRADAETTTPIPAAVVVEHTVQEDPGPATPTRAPPRLYAATPSGRTLLARDKAAALAHGSAMLADLVRRRLDKGETDAAAKHAAELHDAATRLLDLFRSLGGDR